jgi:cytidine deaminase
MPEIPWDKLFEVATAARENGYAPYSRFKVGAALLLGDGTVVPGCNVENASYGLSVCAERGAISRMMSEGQRPVVALAVVAGSTESDAPSHPPTPPCGMCRQVLVEFAALDVPVRCRNPDGQEHRTSVGELMPYAFTPDFLKR